jgi:acetylornithine aminotransferase
MELDGEAGSIIDFALQENLLLVSAGPHVVRLLPPLTITKEQIEVFEEKFTRALERYMEA